MDEAERTDAVDRTCISGLPQFEWPTAGPTTDPRCSAAEGVMAKQRRRIPRYQREADEQARAPGRWDARFCTQELYDHMMAQMPKGAIPADMTKHAAHNSYSPLFWYQDREFICKDCGGSE